MTIDTVYLRRCITSLETAYQEMTKRLEEGDALYELFRAACIKEFELVLEMSGKLLRKRLSHFYSSNRQAETLTFKDAFRNAGKFGLLDIQSIERWLEYRDNRNDTAHEYGEGYAESTVTLLPQFISDANTLADVVEQTSNE